MNSSTCYKKWVVQHADVVPDHSLTDKVMDRIIAESTLPSRRFYDVWLSSTRGVRAAVIVLGMLCGMFRLVALIGAVLFGCSSLAEGGV